MKILITGATGLIGSQIINDALSQGIEVNFLTTRRIKTVNENKLKGFYWNPENSHIENFLPLIKLCIITIHNFYLWMSN